MKGFSFKMYASLGCSVLSATCTAESNILGYFLFSWAWGWVLQKPLCSNPLFLAPEISANERQIDDDFVDTTLQ